MSQDIAKRPLMDKIIPAYVRSLDSKFLHNLGQIIALDNVQIHSSYKTEILLHYEIYNLTCMFSKKIHTKAVFFFYRIVLLAVKIKSKNSENYILLSTNESLSDMAELVNKIL